MTRDTKNIIMDVAEALFAEHGYDGTSLRMITRTAEVNLAAVNYHFGSKEALLEAVYARRINPMNQARIERLNALERRHDEALVPVACLVEAFITPALELSREDGRNQFIALLGRSYLEPTPVQENIKHLFDEVTERYKTAFSLSLPHVRPEDLYWRLHFMVGVLAYCMSGTGMMRMIASSRISDDGPGRALIDRMVDFISHGLQAPGAAPA